MEKMITQAAVLVISFAVIAGVKFRPVTAVHA
jgi:hypothetical protein